VAECLTPTSTGIRRRKGQGARPDNAAHGGALSLARCLTVIHGAGWVVGDRVTTAGPFARGHRRRSPAHHVGLATFVGVIEGGGPERHCGASAAPVVDLACGDAGEPGEGGLTDVGAGEQGGELGVQERSHGALRIELSSIMRSGTPVGEAT
jgi:hypothetical protein